jgi:hypothetical protein
MPLYDVTYGEPRLIKPEDVEKIDFLQALKRKLHPASWLRIIQTVDEGVEATAKDIGSKLIWTKTGALFGNHSNRPKKDVDHLWEKVISIVGDGKECLKSVGALLLWRVALRPEEYWLVYRQETSRIDPDTNKIISVAEYWINTNFVPKKKEKMFTIQDLMDKHNPKHPQKTR